VRQNIAVRLPTSGPDPHPDLEYQHHHQASQPLHPQPSHLAQDYNPHVLRRILCRLELDLQSHPDLR
jgi:hypothetical protein